MDMPYKMVTVQRLGDILKAWNNHFTQLVYTHTQPSWFLELTSFKKLMQESKYSNNAHT